MSTTFSTGVPNLFTSPMTAFGPRSLFHSAERPNESTLGGATFTQEDRLMLHLLYQQQQAMQFQLQSIALSIQQLNMTMTGLPTPSVAVPVYGSSSSVNDPSPSTNATTTTSAPVQTNTSVHQTRNTVNSTPFETRSDQRNPESTTDHHLENASQVKEVSRSCTPPREDSDASRHSLMNHSMDSAAPWDPAAGSRHSSVIHGSRGENPLLSSLRGKLPTPNRSAVGSVSAGTGYSASANISASLEDSKPSIRPTLHPSLSSSFHTEQESQNMSSSRNVGPHTHRQQRIVLDNRKVEHPQRSQSNLETSTVTKNEKSEHNKDWNTGSSQRDRVGNEEYGETNTSVVGYDSQSDGYGSYETREYLKRVGII
ncbi:uncharacterized protein TM35_000024930 [Trypanosoma theileri]|uniref:Uncharacterized protein n=1 Tax=Trypanosoma theileri TaxID=67003 RepID=A0A1X0P893_9TRYP|nr:uncharacterized protein TM35_000024930 [Trypanosoma theileri]ORC93167.1 hypothetical protein TM35_000024930 [Trypanosoma theileri]